MGMAAGSDFVFSGPFEYDRSDLHNPFIYALSRQTGRYAPDLRLAEVFMEVNGGALNFTGAASGDYYGVYNVMEKIRRDADRVNIHKLDTYDNDAVGKTGGFIFKVDRLDSGDSGFSAGGQTMAYYYPKELEIKSPQRDPQEQFLTSYITAFNTALQSSTWKSPTAGYAPYLDVPGAIDHHLMNLWAMNVDGLRLSGYWSKERGGKLLPGPIWDFDRALSSTDGRDSNPATFRSQSGDLGTDFFNFTWWNRLFQDIDFYQKYIDRWQELRRGLFAPANVNSLLDSLNSQVSSEAAGRDVTRWAKAKRAWTSPFTGTAYSASQAAEVQRLKDWLQQRANFFDTQWVGAVTPSVAAGNVTPGTPVTLSGPVGSTIYYTLDGSDPRPSGGAAPPTGTLAYNGTPISINATTRLRARAYNANWLTNSAVLIGANNPPLRSAWGGSTSVRYSVDAPASPANLAITEINYHPVNPTTAELAVNPIFTDSDFEFIELHNIGTVALDLGGMQFTKGVTFKFTDDNAVTLAPGGYLIVAANPSAFAARYPSITNVVGPFTGNLDNTGEEIALVSAVGATVFDFTYDDQWYPTSDGGGSSLIVVNEAANAAAFGTKANWRASAQAGGSPGARDNADVIPPTIPGPFTPLAIATGATGMALIPDYAATANAADNVGVVTLTQSPVAGTPVAIGSAQIAITAGDANGNSTTATFGITITDGTSPTIVGNFAPLTLSTGAGGTVLVPDFVSQAQATDNVGVTSLTQEPAPGTAFTAGNQTVTLRARDAAGNEGTRALALTVLDATAPALSGNFAPLTLSTGPNGNVLLPNYTTQAVSSDNVAVVSVTQLPAPGSSLGIGTVAVTLTAVDAADNRTVLSFNVGVTDGTPPVIAGPVGGFAPLAIATGENGIATLPNYLPMANASDNVGVASLTQNPVGLTVSAVGTTHVVITATDASGNFTAAAFDVAITDGTSPSITGTFTPETVSTGTDGTAVVPDFAAQAQASDNVAVTGLTQEPPAGSSITAGNKTITLRARDAAGNESTKAIALKVLDATPPTLKGPFAPLTLSSGASGTATLPNYAPQAVTSDNVAVTSVTQKPVAGTLVNLGPTPVSLMAKDAAGNEALLTFQVTVGDGTAPTIARPAAGFTPAALATGSGESVSLPDYTTQAVVSDNVAVTSVTQLPTPGTAASAGSKSITLTAHDAAGNTASLSFNIVVGDGATGRGDDVPGLEGAVFTSFGVPALADSGATAYSARWHDAKGAQVGIFSGNPISLLVKAGDPVPTLGGLIFRSFTDPVINADGAVAFVATIQGAGVRPANNTVLITNAFPGGALTVAARKGTSMGEPDGAVLSSFNSISLQGKELLYVGKLAGGRPKVTAANALAAFQVHSDLVSHRVVRTRQPFGATYIKAFRLLDVVVGTPGENRGHVEGNAAFLALLGSRTQALLSFNGSELVPIAETGDPTNSRLLPGTTFRSFGPVAVIPGRTAMAADLTLGVGGTISNNARGIFLSSNTGFEPIAQTSQPAPGLSGETFISLGDPLLAPGGGAVAFSARLSGPLSSSSSAWWKPAAGELRMLARVGMHPPGTSDGVRWKAFHSLAISGGLKGGPILYGQLAPGFGGVTAATSMGIWATDHTGELRLLVRTGDMGSGGKIKALTILSAVPGSPGVTRSFNNSATIIYRATFVDGSQSIVTIAIP